LLYFLKERILEKSILQKTLFSIQKHPLQENGSFKGIASPLTPIISISYNKNCGGNKELKN